MNHQAVFCKILWRSKLQKRSTCTQKEHSFTNGFFTTLRVASVGSTFKLSAPWPWPRAHIGSVRNLYCVIELCARKKTLGGKLLRFPQIWLC